MPAIPPLAPLGAYKTYGWSAPLRTHWRPAKCDEVDCAAYRNGWTSTVDLATELGQRQADFMQHDRSRSCRQEKVGGTLLAFVYGPGNTCFEADSHRVPLGRPALFTLTGTHWMARQRPARIYRGPQDWVDDFAEHQDRIATEIRKG